MFQAQGVPVFPRPYQPDQTELIIAELRKSWWIARFSLSELSRTQHNLLIFILKRIGVLQISLCLLKICGKKYGVLRIFILFKNCNWSIIFNYPASEI